MKFGGKFFNLAEERGALRLSIAITLFVSVTGVGFGLISGSYSILFDGVYSLVDSAMSLLSLLVVNLITLSALSGPRSAKLQERFSMGFWHLEPMVLGLNGMLLISVAIYALFTAVSSLLSGGRSLAFGWAIFYALITLIACVIAALLIRRANRAIQSEFLRLDMIGWIMSAGITAALLVAFLTGAAIEGTRHAWMIPYIDPAVLALVCLFLLPIPVATVRHALADILLVTPPDLKNHVDDIARHITEKYHFTTWRSYVARVGRAKQIELYFVIPRDAPARPLWEWDALRDEVGEAIGDEGPHRWLTIAFTCDLEWAE